MQTNNLKKYTLIKEKKLDDINSQGYLLEHNKTKAKVVLIENDDSNKTFLVGFKTPVGNSTGVPHIMEHSVLCGSRKFPAKDPFIELVKGSLNTFLNAMTFPDKTVFPVASENDKDFQNLMDIYLDAVFYPKIYDRRETFCQEGWTYELKDREDELTVNGVVYNEMKGAFSAPDQVVERKIMNTLYPDTGYAFESGGDPDEIPTLTYEEFLDFHKKYYHPSNSYIFLYGNMDMLEKLDYIDAEYLSRFEYKDIDSEIKLQKGFADKKEFTIEYPVAANEPVEENTYLTYNNVVGNITDKELYVAFQVLEYALVEMPGAPVKQALLDKGIGKDIEGKYNNWIYQPYFSIIAKYAEQDQKEEFISTIFDTLKSLVKDGIDRQSLIAALNYFEFQYREADFGSYPKGIMISLQVFDSWLYDDNEPFIHLEENEVFENLRKKADKGYFEKLVEEYFINNHHASIVVAVPKRGMTTEHDEKFKKELQAKKNAMSHEELDRIVMWTKHMEEYKSEESPKEDLEKIPMLSRNDISKEVKSFHNTDIDIDGIHLVHHDIFSNGIGYFNAIFDLTDIPEQYYKYIGMVKAVLGYMNTEHYTYSQLSNEINMNTGGIAGDCSTITDNIDLNKYSLLFSYGSKVFENKIGFSLKMMQEIINTTEVSDEKRLLEILSELRAEHQVLFSHSGDSVALIRNMSYYSESSYIVEQIKGIAFYKFVDECVKNFDKMKSEIIDGIKKTIRYCFRKDNVIYSYTSGQSGLEMLKEPLKEFHNSLNDKCDIGERTVINVVRKNEGFKTSAQIQYVTRCGSFTKEGFSYNGSLRVLRTILNYEYLWNNVRVLGGAYGCSSGFVRNGDCYFTSYRDPKLRETNKVFENIPEFVRNFDADEREMTKYVIGTISSMDIPLTPRADGSRSMSAYIGRITEDDLRKERKEVLETQLEDIRKQADLIEAVLKQGNICVLGNEENIENEKEMFETTVDLF